MNTALLLGLAVGVSAPALKDPPKKVPAIVGEWALETATLGGKGGLKGPEGVSYEFTADGKWLFRRHGDGANSPPREYKLDPKSDPPSIDVTGGPAPAKPMMGIYMLEGDMLTICFACSGEVERPKNFEAPDGSRFKMVLKRVKKKE